MPLTDFRFSIQVLVLALLLCPWAAVPVAIGQVAESGQTELSIDQTGLANPDISEDKLAQLLIPQTKSELEELAKLWLATVKDKTREVAERRIALMESGEQANEADQRLIADRAALFRKYSMVVTALQNKGGNEDFVNDLRAYRNAVVAAELRLNRPIDLIRYAIDWLTRWDGGLRFIFILASVVFSIAVLLVIARISRQSVSRWISRVPKISRLLQTFLATVAFWLVLVIGLMIVLSGFGIDITPAFALLGGASFILAFALQETLGNLASGMMIMVNRPFDEGDYVDVGGVAGTVKTVTIVATTVLTPDNQVIVIPNKNVWGNVITNVTGSATRRVDLVFGISYGDSVPKAISVMEETVKAHPLVLDHPEPIIRLHELADSSVNFICRPWTKTGDYWTVYWDLMQQIKEGFDEAGISIPFPQHEVHLHSAPQAALPDPHK